MVVAAERSGTGVDEPLHVKYFVVPEDKVYIERFRYVEELVNLLMSKSEVPYTMEAVVVRPVPTSRNVMFLKNDLFNIIWIHTDKIRERELRPIRIPIFRGLIGWRLFLIHKDNASVFQSLESEEQLKSMKCGQGHDWPDVRILENAGFNLRTSYHWAGIFNLLANKRIDYFPRGLVEIWNEMDKINAKEIGNEHEPFAMIEEHIALRYPSAFYLFVTKKNERLALALENGFEKALADGSFLELFNRYFGSYIERSRLTERRIFSIENPDLPPETPLNRKELWFSVDELKGR